MRFVRWLVAVAVIGALHASMASAATKSLCKLIFALVRLFDFATLTLAGSRLLSIQHRDRSTLPSSLRCRIPLGVTAG
jgi:hypothetical protein